MRHEPDTFRQDLNELLVNHARDTDTDKRPIHSDYAIELPRLAFLDELGSVLRLRLDDLCLRR